MTFEPGNYVQSDDERDDPDEVYLVMETDIAHVSGSTSRIRPTGARGREVYADIYRLDANLRRVGIEVAARRLGA